MQRKITRFFDVSEPRLAPRAPRTAKHVVVLGDDPAAAACWRARGMHVVRSEKEARRLPRHEIAFVLVFLQCSDLCVAGARWWKQKRLVNPAFQDEAIAEMRRVERLVRATKAPYAILCPASFLILRRFRTPDVVFHPCEFGGHLDAATAHPTHPGLMPRQDAYKRKTFVFSGNGFTLPRRRPIDPILVTVTVRRRNGRDGQRTKLVSPMFVKRRHAFLRRLAPLGFCEAVAQLHAN